MKPNFCLLPVEAKLQLEEAATTAMSKTTRQLSWSSSKDEEEHQSDEVLRSWSDMTKDILSLILSGLYVADRAAFNAVCKEWKLVRAPPNFLSLKQLTSNFTTSAFFIYQKRNSSTFKLFHSLADQFYEMNIPELKNARIRCSMHGWLLMSRLSDDRGLFFFDPFTKVKMDIPRSDYRFIALSFSQPPSSSNWSIVGIFSQMSSNTLIVGEISCGEDVWRNYAFQTRYKLHVSHSSPVLHQGKYYFLDVSGHLVRFIPDMTYGDKSLRTLPVNRPRRRFQSSVHQSFMAEVNGQLLSVLVSSDLRRIHAEKIDASTNRREAVQDLGGLTLYISHTGTFSQVAATPSMANKIYLPKFYGESGVFYSLITKKYHSYNGTFSSTEPYQLKDLEFGTWIQPNTTCLY
ncbi:hypothetical protein ACH5RR_026516 [Cinchona calisaya]|uniref:KIB1-4 beta-propeller domain-containing protein n=1 Tax=Cinchona calisaya TaxID=153742 RepID=A0ABD2Z3X4_9GENT